MQLDTKYACAPLAVGTVRTESWVFVRDMARRISRLDFTATFRSNWAAFRSNWAAFRSNWAAIA